MENNNIFLVIKTAIVALCGGFTAAFGWLGWLIVAWVACMVIDWISGSAAAAACGEWSSAAAWAGIWHKAGMILVVIVAALADCVLAMVVEHLPGLSIDYGTLVLPMVLAWYIFTELGSIAENATDMGAPVPGWLTKLLAAGKTAVDKTADSDTSENR